MTNPYGPPPGQSPYPQQGAPMPPGYGPPSGPMPQQPMPPGHPQQGYPQQPPAQSPPQGYPQQGMPPGYPQSGPQPQMPPQQQMPQQFPPPPPGMGRLLIDCSFHWLGWAFLLFKPQVTINGQPGPVLTWGKNPIDLPPGQHQIQVHVNYLWKVGNATAVIPVGAGQQLDVYYRAPAIAFIDGAIGPTPQETPGMGLTIGVSIAVFVLVLLAGLLPLVL
ncbi:hypothetical protein [Saccharopolyspora mangrovi]|uniref:Uncharacterized protein n=1 Tax=Saccharopolyspora mangrovi TaxID=3082379 RepID=A0ABU6A5J0_9PSEU|nr:hypothetical protein [Saccharopolyspora sp. S2-29]MEB3366835.1 hypothetical protein [Saccharopolyspora sp. S2-29]